MECFSDDFDDSLLVSREIGRHLKLVDGNQDVLCVMDPGRVAESSMCVRLLQMASVHAMAYYAVNYKEH